MISVKLKIPFEFVRHRLWISHPSIKRKQADDKYLTHFVILIGIHFQIVLSITSVGHSHRKNELIQSQTQFLQNESRSRLNSKCLKRTLSTQTHQTTKVSEVH